MSSNPRRIRALCLAGLALVWARDAQPQEAQPSEYEVKAAFLYNFAKFVEWQPAAFTSSNAPIVIGVLGDDPFGAILDTIVQGKKLGGRDFKVDRSRTIQDLSHSHILYISGYERRRLRDILDQVKQSNVLTVSDMDQFSQQDGIIQFIMEGNKVRFRINAQAAERAGLRLSAKLLSLSR